MPNRPSLPPGAKYVKPHQLGWMRRSEFDTETGEAWEKPDGTMMMHDKRAGTLILAFMKHMPKLED